MSKSPQSPEDLLIARYFRPLATAPGAFGLIDDAAALAPPPGCDLVLTTDGVIAGVHFFPDDPPQMVSRKVLRMNLSDLAAKGARPLGFLLSVALPADCGEAWLGAFAEGLAEDAARYGIPLFGGDTDHTPGPISVSIFAFGAVPQGKMVHRSTARPGDHIVVTGTIGDAAIGLQLRRDRTLMRRWGLSAAAAAELEGRYLLPQPRNALADAVLQYASAAIDVSDGLAGDLGKLCRASSVATDIDIARVPLSDAARAAIAAEPAFLETALTGGDDYEIVVTVAPEKRTAFRKAAEAASVPVTEIGRVQAGEGVRFLRDRKRLTFTRASYSHF